MRPIPGRAYGFVAITCLAAIPFIALGVEDALGADAPATPVAFYIWALCVLLSFRPVRIAPNVELSASEVAVLAGVVLLPPGELALVAAAARLVIDIASRKSPVRVMRHVPAQAPSPGTAAVVFQLTLDSRANRVTRAIGGGALAASRA